MLEQIEVFISNDKSVASQPIFTCFSGFQNKTENKVVRDKTEVRETKCSEANSIARIVEQAVERVCIGFEQKMDTKLEKFLKKVQEESEAWNRRFEEKDVKCRNLKGTYPDIRDRVNSITPRFGRLSITEESEDDLKVFSRPDNDGLLVGKRHTSVDSQDSGHLEVNFRSTRP